MSSDSRLVLVSNCMVIPRSRAQSARTFAILLLGFAIAAPLDGAAPPECEPRSVSTSSARWAAPLDRPIKLNAGTLPLKEAIDHISSLTGLRFSYSGSHVPLEKIVCLSYREAPLGDILADLLTGAAAAPVIARLDHSVLATRTEQARAPQQ